jgi:hypothetical protein
MSIHQNQKNDMRCIAHLIQVDDLEGITLAALDHPVLGTRLEIQAVTQDLQGNPCCEIVHIDADGTKTIRSTSFEGPAGLRDAKSEIVREVTADVTRIRASMATYTNTLGKFLTLPVAEFTYPIGRP